MLGFYGKVTATENEIYPPPTDFTCPIGITRHGRSVTSPYNAIGSLIVPERRDLLGD